MIFGFGGTIIFGNTHIFLGFPHLDALAIDLKGFFTDLPSYLRQQENDPLVQIGCPNFEFLYKFKMLKIYL